MDSTLIYVLVFFILCLQLSVSQYGVDGNTVERSTESQEIRTLVFGSCSKTDHDQPLWEPINNLKPDVFVWLGDNIYADRKLGKRSVYTGSKWEWLGEEKVKEMYRKQLSFPGYDTLQQTTKIVGVWDDHDFGYNNMGKDFTSKALSQRLMLDFLHEPMESPRRRQAGVHVSYTFGQLGRRVRLILLDTRYHRDAIGSDGTMLGEEQWAWLEQELAKQKSDPVEVTLIGSSIQVVNNHYPFMGSVGIDPECWVIFPKERRRLFKMLHQSQVSGVIFLSGDVHYGEVTEVPAGCALSYPLLEATSSGMTHTVTGFVNSLPWKRLNLMWQLEDFLPDFMDILWPAKYRQERFIKLNFGSVTFDWGREGGPKVCTNIHDRTGAVRIKRCHLLRDLQASTKPQTCHFEQGAYFGEDGSEVTFMEAMHFVVICGLMVLTGYSIPIFGIICVLCIVLKKFTLFKPVKPAAHLE